MQVINEEKTFRRQVISRAVESYIRNNPREFELFKQEVERKRISLNDPILGKMQGDKDDSTRLAFRMPEKIVKAIDFVFNEHGEQTFGTIKKENSWVAKKYPVFLIPKKY